MRSNPSLSLRLLTPCLAGALLFGAAPASAQKTLDAYAQPSLKDVSASVDVVSKNDRELGKIGKGYVDAYKLTEQVIQYKEPGRVRFQGKRGLFTIRYITNGGSKLTEVPTLRIRKKADISKEPAKGDSINDLGVLTPSWAARVQDRWLRTETREGKTLQVFEYWYKEDPRYRHTLWIDPETRTIAEHVAHHRNPKRPGFKKRFVYGDVKQVNGVWLPTKVMLYNGENNLAATMRYESIKVNAGLKDSLFSI
jgi:hypothetical protein